MTSRRSCLPGRCVLRSFPWFFCPATNLMPCTLDKVCYEELIVSHAERIIANRFSAQDNNWPFSAPKSDKVILLPRCAQIWEKVDRCNSMKCPLSFYTKRNTSVVHLRHKSPRHRFHAKWELASVSGSFAQHENETGIERIRSFSRGSL